MYSRTYLEHGSNFGRKLFLLPPMTHMGDSETGYVGSMTET